MSTTWNAPAASSVTVAAFRTVVNDCLETLRTVHSGTADPASMVAFMLQVRSDTGVLQIRNAANSAWLTLFPNVAAAGGGALLLSGGTMTGAIAMGTNKVTGLGTGTAAADAVTKAQVDAQAHVAMAYIAGFNATLNRPAFTAPAGGCTILAAYLLSDTATAGSGAGTRYDFQLRNVGVDGAGTTDMLSVVKTTNGAEIGVYDSYNLGVDQNQALTEGQSLQLRITMTGSPTSLASAQIQLAIHYKSPV